MSDGPFENTDRELWRERRGDYYADSLFVTESGGIGMNCGGHVIVRPLREWHRLASKPLSPRRDYEDPNAPEGMWDNSVGEFGNCSTCGERLPPPSAAGHVCAAAVERGVRETPDIPYAEHPMGWMCPICQGMCGSRIEDCIGWSADTRHPVVRREEVVAVLKSDLLRLSAARSGRADTEKA